MPLLKSLSFRGLGLTFPGMETAAQVANAAGFDALDLPIRDLFENHISPTIVRNLLADHGLAIGACPFPLDWRSRESAYLQTLNSLPAYIDYISILGVKNLYTRVSESVSNEETPESTIAWHLHRLGKIAEMLHQNQLKLGFETVGVASFRQGRPPLMPTLADVRHHLSSLFHEFPNTGLLVDAFHLHASGESLEAAISGFENRVVGVHVADLPWPTPPDEIIDNLRSLPDTSGSVPVRQILAGLAARGISAPVMIETVANIFAEKSLDHFEIGRQVAASLGRVFPPQT